MAELMILFKSGERTYAKVKDWTYERDRHGNRSLKWTSYENQKRDRLITLDLDSVDCIKEVKA